MDKKQKERDKDSARLAAGEDPKILQEENSFFPVEFLKGLKIVSVGRKKDQKKS